MTVCKVNPHYQNAGAVTASPQQSIPAIADRRAASAVPSSDAGRRQGRASHGVKLNVPAGLVLSQLLSGQQRVSAIIKNARQLVSTAASKNGLVSIALLVALLVSGVMTVYGVHLNRQLFMELKVLQAEEDRAQRRWTQLLLEESAWSAPGHVEHIASTRLGMATPRAEQVEMVR